MKRAGVIRGRMSRALAARDPGRMRLIAATAVALGVLGSALFALGGVHVLHADSALLAMAVFLSVQAGNVVKDPTVRGRVATAALLIPCVVLAVTVAAVLSAWRPAAIAVFVALTGAAIWVRRFGPRATAIGTMGFLAYFFTLFMRPSLEELPAYCVIAVGAVAAQLIARLVLQLSEHPKRRLVTLLTELRVASAAALVASLVPGHARVLRARLARIDAIGRAVASWQHSFRTDAYVRCDEETLDEIILDARVDTEDACLEVASVVGVAQGTAPGVLVDTVAHLQTVLDDRASPSQIAVAYTWANAVLTGSHRAVEYLIARSVLAHGRARGIDLTPAAPAHPTRPSAQPQAAPPRPLEGARHAVQWIPWSRWEPTTRLAVQAMAAATIATVAGEAISASRWYWAVLTAFVIFLGTTTRSGILTRAFRRVTGTALGIVVGVPAVLVAHHDNAVLIAICVAGIFAMLYFGPLNYVYSSFFMTVMLIAIYGMLGVLDGSIVELRLEETIVGAVIGVLCAYLILSSNSHPALIVKVNAFFDALDQLLRDGAAVFANAGASADILASIHALEACQEDLRQTVSAMSTAFLIGAHDREASGLHLIAITTRSAARFGQCARARRAIRHDWRRGDLRCSRRSSRCAGQRMPRVGASMVPTGRTRRPSSVRPSTLIETDRVRAPTLRRERLLSP